MLHASCAGPGPELMHRAGTVLQYYYSNSSYKEDSNQFNSVSAQDKTGSNGLKLLGAIFGTKIGKNILTMMVV